MPSQGTTLWAPVVNTRSSGAEDLKRRPIGQPHRPRTRYCSIGFQPVSSVHGTEARQTRPFVPTVKNTRSSGLEGLKGPKIGDRYDTYIAEVMRTSRHDIRLRKESVSLGPFRDSKPEERVFFTMGTKGLAWRASVPWTLDTGWKPMLQ